MAHYKTAQNIYLQTNADLEADRIEREIFDGQESPTLIKVKTSSATIDEFTEEITYSGQDTQVPVSGIIGTIAEGDMLLGAEGRVNIGDIKLTYTYRSVSGILLDTGIKEVTLIGAPLSGLYQVAKQYISHYADTPMLVKLALIKDQNG